MLACGMNQHDTHHSASMYFSFVVMLPTWLCSMYVWIQLAPKQVMLHAYPYMCCMHTHTCVPYCAACCMHTHTCVIHQHHFPVPAAAATLPALGASLLYHSKLPAAAAASASIECFRNACVLTAGLIPCEREPVWYYEVR